MPLQLPSRDSFQPSLARPVPLTESLFPAILRSSVFLRSLLGYYSASGHKVFPFNQNDPRSRKKLLNQNCFIQNAFRIGLFAYSTQNRPGRSRQNISAQKNIFRSGMDIPGLFGPSWAHLGQLRSEMSPVQNVFDS